VEIKIQFPDRKKLNFSQQPQINFNLAGKSAAKGKMNEKGKNKTRSWMLAKN